MPLKWPSFSLYDVLFRRKSFCHYQTAMYNISVLIKQYSHLAARERACLNGVHYIPL
jgi:hypothetical protein